MWDFITLARAFASVCITNLHLQFHARQPKTSIAIAAVASQSTNKNTTDDDDDEDADDS